MITYSLQDMSQNLWSELLDARSDIEAKRIDKSGMTVAKSCNTKIKRKKKKKRKTCCSLRVSLDKEKEKNDFKLSWSFDGYLGPIKEVRLGP